MGTTREGLTLCEKDQIRFEPPFPGLNRVGDSSKDFIITLFPYAPCRSQEDLHEQRAYPCFLSRVYFCQSIPSIPPVYVDGVAAIGAERAVEEKILYCFLRRPVAEGTVNPICYVPMSPFYHVFGIYSVRRK